MTAASIPAASPPPASRVAANRKAALHRRGLDVRYVRINEIDITLNADKTQIDDTDHIDFRVSWRVPLTAEARDTLSETFDVMFPYDHTLAFSGPAPQGFDLAAAIGIRRVEMPVDPEFVVLEDDEEWMELISTFSLGIDPDTDDVTLNGASVLTLSPDAHVLD